MGRLSVVLATTDALAAMLSFYAAVCLRFAFDMDFIDRAFGTVGPRAATFTVWFLVGMVSMGLYRPRQRPTVGETAARVVLATGVGGLANIVFFYVFPDLNAGRGVMAIAMLITCAAVFGARLAMLRLIDWNPIKRRVLVIGAGDPAAKIHRLRRRADRRRFDVVAFVALSDQERAQAGRSGIEPVIDAEAVGDCGDIDEIVVAVDDRRGRLPVHFLLDQKQRGVPVIDLVHFLERETERLDLDVLRPSWLLYEKSSQTDILYRSLKRICDILFSALLLVLVSPVLLLAVLAIKIEDGMMAPIVYRQRRVGRNGRIFRLVKFRSMRVDAEKDTGPRFAARRDERVTRVGQLLRRFRIDELPQLLNVIAGDMSVVGPRPERPEFVDELSRQVPLYFYRHGVRPGLTGWAQINFPYGASLDDAREKLKYDLYYIKNATLVMDALILLQTLEIVVWGRGTSMSGMLPAADERRGGDIATPALARDKTGRDAA